MSHATKTPNNQASKEVAAEKNRNAGRQLRQSFRHIFGTYQDGSFTDSSPDAARVIACLRSTAGSNSPSFLPTATGSYCPIAAAFRDGRKSILLEIAANSQPERDPNTGESADAKPTAIS